MAYPAQSIQDLGVLASVTREGSFSAAARALGMTRAEVSRIVARLERSLDLRLFTRTTRQVVATDAARALVGRLEPALAEIDAALAAVSEREHGMLGPIRLSCSHALGRHVLLPLLADFQAEHPQVEFSLGLSDRFEDLLARELDLSLRLGQLPESSLVARRLGHLVLALVALPALTPAVRTLKAEELCALPAVRFRLPNSGEPSLWRLQSGAIDTPVGPGRVRVETDSIEAVADFVRAGVGAALLPRYLVARDLAAGVLVELQVAGGRFVGPPLHLCFIARERMPRRVRVLCDYLIERLPVKLGLAKFTLS